LAWRLSRDRVAQTVARMYLEPKVEPIVHPDSYGYRPGRLALDAVGACRERCWRADWFIDLDIKKFFMPYDLVLKAVAPTYLSRNRWRSKTANSSTACTPADDRPPAVITACELVQTLECATLLLQTGQPVRLDELTHDLTSTAQPAGIL
jgi:hypothetical protein